MGQLLFGGRQNDGVRGKFHTCIRTHTTDSVHTSLRPRSNNAFASYPTSCSLWVFCVCVCVCKYYCFSGRGESAIIPFGRI